MKLSSEVKLLSKRKRIRGKERNKRAYQKRKEKMEKETIENI
jgi:hypothetical protein